MPFKEPIAYLTYFFPRKILGLSTITILKPERNEITWYLV